ncbi:MAG TPA: aminodeoxychorismate/anthranilate synthase component II [Bacteroidetes bacterium]|nr:aminodeoxychorismate/anthranilate synthase component II [Bacteroidota bacterium]
MNVLVIDNYDSFVYNLVHMMYEIGVTNITVRKNDEIIPREADRYDKILLSPGPGVPAGAGRMPEIISLHAPHKSILGVCLGHQAIAEAFGGRLVNMDNPLHGISSNLFVQKKDYLFERLPRTFRIGHYHSWVVSPALPGSLECLAVDENNQVMALRHQTYDLRGLQFHPESVLTMHGIKLLTNWIKH